MQGYTFNNSGSIPKYLKTAATPKHYADYSVEANRDSFDAKVYRLNIDNFTRCHNYSSFNTTQKYYIIII